MTFSERVDTLTQPLTPEQQEQHDRDFNKCVEALASIFRAIHTQIHRQETQFS